MEEVRRGEAIRQKNIPTESILLKWGGCSYVKAEFQADSFSPEQQRFLKPLSMLNYFSLLPSVLCFLCFNHSACSPASAVLKGHFFSQGRPCPSSARLILPYIIL